MIQGNVKLNLKGDEVSDDIAKTMDGAFSGLLAMFETEIANLTPSITGNLKGSITAEKTGFLEGQVSTNVEYAVYVEYGTSRFAPRAMFRKGIQNMQEKGLGLLLDKLKNIRSRK